MLERLAAEAEIHRVLNRYAHAVDRGDEAMVRSVYHPDGIDEHGAYFTGLGRDFGAYVTAQKPCWSAMMHHRTNVLIERSGDAAAVESYMFGMLVDHEESLSWAAGRYLDLVQWRSGAWKLAHRRYVTDIRIPLPREAAGAPPRSESSAGRRSAADPAYELFAATGAHRRSPSGEAARRPTLEAALSPSGSSDPEADVAGASSLDATVARLVAEAEITRVLNRYCHGVDRGDEEMIRSVYHPDGIDEHGAHFVGSGSDFAAFVTAQKPNFAVLMHHLTSILIEVRDDVAAVQSYVVAMHVMRDGIFSWAAGRYLDRFERRTGEWKIAHRRFVLDLDLPAPAEPVAANVDGSFGEGSRSPSDPAYALFDAVAAGRRG
ncbi:MAG: nuclear transport factor 2 family protein [Actinomycetia bacterium]|nr:nuclear transport factor 2 family protein [Actinomycetes bacterium]